MDGGIFTLELPEEQYSLLIVDDNEMNRDLLQRRLNRDNIEAATAENGQQALEMMRKQPFDLVLLDVMMPVMDGYQTLESIIKDPDLSRTPVIMITAVDNVDNAANCIELGAVDYITKPFNPTLLMARVNSCLERKRLSDKEERYRKYIERANDHLSDRVRQQVKKLSEAQLSAIFAMSKLAESRDPETGEHLERMREYCRVLSEKLGGTEKYRSVIDRTFIDNIYAASPLHDIGKVGVDDDVLQKPGKLTPEEWVQMRKHPVIGAETLREVDRQHPGNSFIRTGIEIAESHHEKWDGSGYPYGLAGEEIPLVARILALGDVYDALTSKRCYKDALTHEESFEIIDNNIGKHFDPDVGLAFKESQDEFQRIRHEFQDPE